jgi:hypothetical protein
MRFTFTKKLQDFYPSSTKLDEKRHMNMSLSFLTLSFEATQVQRSSPFESPDEELGR